MANDTAEKIAELQETVRELARYLGEALDYIELCADEGRPPNANGGGYARARTFLAKVVRARP